MLSRLRFAVWVLMLFGSVSVSAQQNFADSELKDAIPRPQGKFEFDIQFYNAGDDYTLLSDREGRRKAIAELRRQAAATPNDPAIWMRLGRHYDKSEQEEQENAAYAKAVQLLRAQVKSLAKLASVERAKRMAHLGKAIHQWHKGNNAEAEKWLRNAVRLAPKEWSVWNELAAFLPAMYDDKLYPKLDPMLWRNSKDFADFRRKLPAPTPKDIAAADRLKKEALRCADTAVRLAPKRGEPYRTRVEARVAFMFADLVYRSPQTELPLTQPSAVNVLLHSWTQPNNSRDMRLSARYSEDALGTAYAALGEWLTASIRISMEEQARGETSGQLALISGANWNKYSAETRQSLTDATAKLQKIAAAKPQERPLALAACGILQVQMQQKPQGIAKMRAALKLRPGYTAVRELLMAIVSWGNDFDEGESVLKDNVQYADSPRNRMALVNFYERHDKYDQAREQLTTARKRFPKDGFMLLWAASDLMSEHLKDKLAEVETLLDEADKNLPADDDNRPIYELLRGVEAYLSGKTDDGIARIKAVATADPNNEQAQELLELFQRE
jgi:tetratricopeptide (TPR) repeat protein